MLGGALNANSNNISSINQLGFTNASGSGSFELGSSASKLGVNAGALTDTMLEVGGTASISGALTTYGTNTFSGTGSSSFAGSLDISKGLRAGANTAFTVQANASANSLFVANSGNVGIGTAEPGAKLVVYGGDFWIDSSTAQMNFRNSAVNKWAITTSNDELNFYDYSGTAGTRVTIQNTTGNVGIGTAEPGTKLHVHQTAAASTAEELARFTVSDDASSYLKIDNFNSTDSLFTPQFHGYYGGATQPGLTLYADALSDTGTVALMQFKSTVAGGAVGTRPLFQWLENTSPVVTIDNAGNVGIGTANVDAKFEVIGTASISQSVFLATQSGNVGIGTTTAGNKLSVYGAIEFPANATGTFRSEHV